MPFDGSGIFQRVRNWVADAAAGVKIRADLHDSEDDGFALGLTNCITKDGQTTITQNIPWNNKRITSLADPVNPQDAATKAYTDVKVGATLPLAGGKMTGDLEIEKLNPQIFLDSTANSSWNGIQGQMLNKLRWWLRLGDGSAESSGNVGSNFDLHRYADDGAYLGRALFFSRQTGLGVVAGDPTEANGIATKNYADVAAINNASNRVLRAGDTMTGNLVSAQSSSILAGGPVGSFEVRGPSTDAVMSFHRVGAFGTNFGMLSDGNFYFGGWSYGSQYWRFWTTKDFAALPAQGATNFKFVHIADWNNPWNSVMNEPYNGGIITGLVPIYMPDGADIVTQYRFRQLQVEIGGTWYNVNYG